MSGTFLQGHFAPVTEEITAHDLPVTGRIPADLNGRYLRNGPNPRGPENSETYSWFAGDGMVHGVRLRDGRAEWYRNRSVRSQRVAEQLGEQWPGGPVFSDMDYAPNVHVIGHAGRTLALTEGGFRPYELGYELDTIGVCDFGGTLKGGYTAHPKKDPETGELHAIGYFFGWEHLEYTVQSADGEIVRSVDIPISGSPMVHDLALTQKYLIIYDLPITASTKLAEAGYSLPYAWDDTHWPRIGLLPRDGDADDVRWIEIDPCFVFHTVNAYDDGDQVVVDVVKYSSFLNGGRLEGNPPPTLDRWRIDPAAGKVVQQTLDDRNQEFPRVDERVVSLPHRYGYTVATQAIPIAGSEVGEALIKRDYHSGRTEIRDFQPGSAVGEALFVPATGDAGEDDGYLMTLVHDPQRAAADLVIIASQDFTGEPVAVVHLPSRVPIGIHGSWIPDPT